MKGSGEVARRGEFYKVEDGKIIGGVCAGVAEYYGMNPLTVRLLYCGAHFFGLPMVVVYALQWLVYPSKQEHERRAKDMW
ncbi:DNA-binding transcriptional activator PspC [Corynebacterium felinum]|nr:DNA-binding transcriptional activator PspC [Corynebacterium felinum]